MIGRGSGRAAGAGLMVSSGVTGRVWVGGEGLRSKDGVALGLAGGIVGRSVSILATGAGDPIGLCSTTADLFSGRSGPPVRVPKGDS